MNMLFLNVGGLELIVILLLSLIYIYTFYHAITNPNLTGNLRIVWIIVLLVLNGLGVILYWLFGKNGSR
ncbi:PLDc N-terminal domain-containing protein [Sphingobacterium psychroaquaticum]|uniref:Phospholipase_D-nuclease N-terminal n=1 Tax=Sphingobacterium psychroaquaticum TaxID=561061 RepID=A0A1X7KSY1_9SPHI|nr:PLDc N-terminal domain-containing protein [Sphingobacterium psychroaquaticum]QBQ40640.1 hypothetical protein E2P86_05530 [Sphingobacterium psychroaquaticum]SMG44670.1 Phospholipase_D-nuclease N-terminal [Sphingobacterium psychroaquaticum]